MINRKFKKKFLFAFVPLCFILILIFLHRDLPLKTIETIDVNQIEGEQNISSLSTSTKTVKQAKSISALPSQSMEPTSDQVVTTVSSTTITVTSEPSVSDNAISLSANRVTYQDGFYYEDITDPIKDRIQGLSYKDNCTVPYEDLKYLSVKYINFNGVEENGELICNKSIANDLLEIFYELYLSSYPIDKIKLIDEYQADDDLSCADNNTSSFNYRVVEGSKKLSKHALGLAIDINPVYNPYVTYPNGQIRISPAGSELYADRTLDFPHKICESDLCYQLFIQHGFTWGGSWNSLKDYQHFQKSS